MCARCRIDTWARACVPVKKVVRKDDRKAEKNPRRSGSRASVGSISMAGSRTPSRFGVHTLPEEAPKPQIRNQVIPLVDEREEDEEEAMLRDLKEREARKMRDEQVRTERKAAAEIEEAAKLASVKDDKKKQFAYDSEGNVIVVQPPQVHRLPNMNAVPMFSCKQEEAPKAQEKPKGKGDKAARGKRENSVEYKDGFKKFLSQQPSMMEAMVMSSGVELEERNRTKKSEKAKAKPETMSRKEYEDMAKGAGPPPQRGTEEKKPTPPKAPLETPRAAPLEPAPPRQQAVQATQAARETPEPARDAREHASEAAKVVRSDVGSDLVRAPHAPATARPIQPVPPSVRRIQTKRDALGYVLSTRERPRADLGSRFPQCAAQPPLGATMGHGLAPSPRKYEDYYFPNTTANSQLAGEEEAAAPVQRIEGQIVSKNPQLKSRLFGK
ncbi:unnamed protein product [Effrenium voratum]|nr:unnamed protein product [Effrenium voratum]